MNDMALTFPPELLKRHAVIYVGGVTLCLEI